MSNIQLTIGGKTARSKAGQHPVEIDFDALPETSRDFIVRYGLKQYLADGMAGAESEADAKIGIDARLAKLKSGDMSRANAGAGLAKPDTVEGRALKLARQAIRAAMLEAGIKADKEAVNDAAAEMVKSDDAWTTTAKKQLDAEKAMATESKANPALAAILANLKPKAE